MLGNLGIAKMPVVVLKAEDRLQHVDNSILHV